MENGGTKPRGPFESLANEAIKFHLVEEPEATSEELWHSRANFPPEFTHQLFGEDEVIVGYENLKINIYQHAASFLTHVDIKYDQKLQKSGPRRKVHDLTKILKENFPSGFCHDRDEFAKQLPLHSAGFPDMLEKHGKLVVSVPMPDPDQPCTSSSYEVWHMDLKDVAVQQWHARLQPSTLFFIENASLIDSKDPQWELWAAVERRQGSSIDGKTPPAVVVVAGFCTAFRFFHWPDNTRLRISQVVVLPPYQGRGHGCRLLEAASAEAKGKDCYDVTVEDPNEALQSLRETLDARDLLAFPPIVDALASAISKCEHAGPPSPSSSSTHPTSSKPPASSSRINKSGGSCASTRQNPLMLGKGVMEEVRKTLKISHRQLSRCWEILLWLGLKDAGTREWWKRLVLRRLYAENLAGNREKEAAHEKRIVDTLEKEDGKMMFFLFRAPKRQRTSTEPSGAEGGGGAAAEEDSGAAKQELTEDELTQKKREALTELFALREEEVSTVCKRLERMKGGA